MRLRVAGNSSHVQKRDGHTIAIPAKSAKYVNKPEVGDFTRWGFATLATAA